MICYEYYSPKRSLFGFGCREKLKEVITEAGYHKAMIVTDETLVKLGIVGMVSSVLDEASVPYVVFDQVKPNPTVANAEAGLAVFQENGCDFLVSIGGGSAHDCAKAIGIVHANGGSVRSYRGTNKSLRPATPVIAVNTTSGTGSECTRAYVLVDEKTEEKYGNRDKNALVSLAVNDHELMMNLPANLTAGTGMDALTHAIECYSSVNSFLLTRELAITSIRLIFNCLEEAVHSHTEKSREGMATAQYLAGLAFGNGGVGLVHSMSHQLSAVYNLPHGLCNAILLPQVMRFNSLNTLAMQRYSEISHVVFPVECAEKDDEACCDILIEKITVLSQAVGTKIALGDLGVRRQDVALLAAKALKDGSLPNNPVLPSAEQIEAIYEDLI